MLAHAAAFADAKPVYFTCAQKRTTGLYSQGACMLAHAAAFAGAKPVYFTCAQKRTAGLYSPGWSTEVAGTRQWSGSESAEDRFERKMCS